MVCDGGGVEPCHADLATGGDEVQWHWPCAPGGLVQRSWFKYLFPFLKLSLVCKMQ
jgi:hypothetical protein